MSTEQLEKSHSFHPVRSNSSSGRPRRCNHLIGVLAALVVFAVLIIAVLHNTLLTLKVPHHSAGRSLVERHPHHGASDDHYQSPLSATTMAPEAFLVDRLQQHGGSHNPRLHEVHNNNSKQAGIGDHQLHHHDEIATAVDLLQEAAGDPALDGLLRSKATVYTTPLFHYVDLPALVPRDGAVRQSSRRSLRAAAVAADESEDINNNNFLNKLPTGVCVTCYDVISIRPRVYHFHNVTSAAEANALRDLGLPLLSRSGVFAKQAIQRSVRSSFGARLPNNDPVVAAVDERLMYIVNNFIQNKSRRMFKAGNAERLELLQYQGSQTYYGHLDNFGGIDGPLADARRRKIKTFQSSIEMMSTRHVEELSLSAPQEEELRKAKCTADENLHKLWTSIRDPLLDRGATMILFLNDMDDSPGGHTTFPFAAPDFDYQRDPVRREEELGATDAARKRWNGMLHGFNTAKDSACSTTPASRRGYQGADGKSPVGSSGSSRFLPFLSVKPRLGDVVLFYDLYENGVSDPFALHAGCPPIAERDMQSEIDALVGTSSEQSRHEPHDDDDIQNVSKQAARSAARAVVAQRHQKFIVTKWFMLPILLGVPKPSYCKWKR